MRRCGPSPAKEACASAAMVFSLIVAFVVTPWATVRLLRRQPGGEGAVEVVGDVGDDNGHWRRGF